MSRTPLLPEHLFIALDAVPGVQFRLAACSDCRALHAACYPEKRLSQFQAHCHHLLDWQENGRCHWLVGTNKADQIVASGQLVLYPHGAELANLSVVPDRQGEGLGTAMVQILTAIARHLKLPGVEIGVAVENGRVLALYQRLGFIEDRRLHALNDEPAIILHKAL